MTEKEFKLQYIDESYGGYDLKMTPCCFLNEDGSCDIESCKPISCRNYPFIDQPERLFSLLGIVNSTSVCPVVFEIFERLKDEYKFKRRKS